MNKCKINVLGTIYTITESNADKDPHLAECDGYCDKTTKKIVITEKGTDCNLGNWQWYQNKVTRHEIIHAFMFESGLHENFKHTEWGQDETTVDWFAVQFPKIAVAFQKAGCFE